MPYTPDAAGACARMDMLENAWGVVNPVSNYSLLKLSSLVWAPTKY